MLTRLAHRFCRPAFVGLAAAVAAAAGARLRRPPNVRGFPGTDTLALVHHGSEITANATAGVGGHGDVAECDKSWLNMQKSNLDVSRFQLFPGAEIIVDVGGNAGFDIGLFLQRFPGAKIFSYEPIPLYAGRLQTEWAHNPNVTVQSFGLSDADRTSEFNVDLAASGEVNLTGAGSAQRVQGRLRDVHGVLAELDRAVGRAPDVFSINCEGCEYAVLQRLSDQGWLTGPSAISYVQISWHFFSDVATPKAKRCEIEKKLRQNYEPVWWADYGWQGWRKKWVTVGVAVPR